MNKGTILRLEGVTQKGKNRISQGGNLWRVAKFKSCVAALNNNPGILLESLKDPQKFWMWIKPLGDKDVRISLLKKR